MELQGRVIKDALQTSWLKDPLEFQVYLPPCYAESLQQRYPVLYLIHGQSYTDQQWVDLGATRVADQLIKLGKAAPFIIVMPRDRIWTEPVNDGFGDAFIFSLMPYIDTTYRTLPDRQYRAVGGLSRGGGWAVHFGLKNWQLFGAFGANSLAVFWEDTSRIEKWLDAIPMDQMPRIYLDIGDLDRPEIMNSATWFEAKLTRRNIPHEWHLFVGYHEDKYWEGHVEQYLLWYTDEW
jgi:enterochelin esterase-like enzyme